MSIASESSSCRLFLFLRCLRRLRLRSGFGEGLRDGVSKLDTARCTAGIEDPDFCGDEDLFFRDDVGCCTPGLAVRDFVCCAMTSAKVV